MQITKCIPRAQDRPIAKNPHPSFNQSMQWLSEARQEYLTAQANFDCAQRTLKRALVQVNKLSRSYHD